jgi:hypothetical protein
MRDESKAEEKMPLEGAVLLHPSTLLPHPFETWPGLERLERFSGFLTRLGALPERVGPISLAQLRDTRLPLPATWPPGLEVAAPRPGPEVDGDPTKPASLAWLAAVYRSASGAHSDRLATLLDAMRGRPEWTLTRMWLLECALACPEAPEGEQRGALLADLGDLYCQTGDIVQGVQLIDDARALRHPDDPEGWSGALRAARWISIINPVAAIDRLVSLRTVSAPAAVRFHATLELMGRDREPASGFSTAHKAGAADAHSLMRRAREADEVVRCAADAELAETDRAALRRRALILSGRWLGASRIRSLREEGRDRLVDALQACAAVDDYHSLSLVLDALGRAHLRLGSFHLAREVLEESIVLKQKLRDLWGLGASLTGLAECLLAAGQPRESLPYFQVNLLLLETLGSMQVLFVRNLARHLNALVAAGCDPLETTPPPPDLLELSRELLARCSSFVANAEADPYCLLLGGSYRRLAARNASSDEQRRKIAEEGIRQAERARELFVRQNNHLRVAEANRTLAALLLDCAAAAIADCQKAEAPGGESSDNLPSAICNLQSPAELGRARQSLEEAEQLQQGEAGRVQAELLWARYHQLAGAPYQMQLHLAAARRAAEACGYHALALGVDSRLGVRLTGPVGAVAGEQDEVVLVALPDEVLTLEVRAGDWRDRPLPAYALRAVVEAEVGPCPTVTPARLLTDHFGLARFEIHARGSARAVFRAATPDGVHSLALRVVVRPVTIEWAADLPGTDDPQTSRLLRQLFGPSCPRLRITRAFASGHSGTRVLLVEPFRDGEQGQEMRGQPCIVKLGPRALLEDERRRYLRWVKELLPVNISRLDGFTVLHDRAALRMSLVGGTGRGQLSETREWLVSAAAFDAHVLLERVFVGDLAACWYGNSPRLREPRPIEELYGRMIPCLLHLADSRSTSRESRYGDASAPAETPTRLAEGLRPAAARSFRLGDEVVVAGSTVLGHRPAKGHAGSPGDWEYELQASDGALRFTYRTSLPPELLEADGRPGGRSLVRGVIEATAHDRLSATLKRCCAVFNDTHPGESVTLSDDGRWLLVRTAEVSRRWSNPLDHLARLATTEVSCNWSLIHGDLHGRNVLVSPQGQPFYIDFAHTGPGPTLYDFIKFEVYLWHESFAGWPHGEPPAECNLAQAVRLMEELAHPDSARHFPSPYARRETERQSSWLALFRQCLATLRSAARPHVVDAAGRDYFVPLALYSALMLRWCDPPAEDERKRRRLARQGVLHALEAAALLDGVLAM